MAPSAEILPFGKRAATRARICEAATELFFEVGFAAVTMDKIAAAAGIRRSTLYLHFREKDEILGAIAQDYTMRLQAVIAHLPSPAPTREEIAAWVDEMATFVSGERATTELLVSLSHLPKAPAAAREFGAALQRMMAERAVAFRRALEPGEALAYAWSVTAMDGLGWALCHHARTGGDPVSAARLAVATDQLNHFIRGNFLA